MTGSVNVMKNKNIKKIACLIKQVIVELNVGNEKKRKKFLLFTSNPKI